MAFPVGVKAYWKLEDVNDVTGAYTLTNTGTTTFSAGKINNAATFNGSSQSLNNNSIWGSVSYPKSYAGWVKFDSVAIGGDQAIFAIGDGSTHYYSLKLRDSDDHIVFRSNNNTEAGDVDTGVTASASTWYHVAVVQHSATSVSLYVNGTKTNTTATTYSATVSQFFLGYLGRSGVWYLDGQIDEVGFWGKALSEAEVTALYNSGNGISDYLTLAAVSYWKLDESSGNASDSVGSNTLTNNGTSTYTTSKINNGIDFGASNSTKSAKFAGNLGIAGTGDLTISCWVKLNTEIGSGTYDFATHRSQLTADRYINLAYEYNSGTRRLKINAAGTAITYEQTLGTSNWYHLVVTRSSSNIVMYMNGSSVATGSQGSAGASSDYFALGYDGGASEYSSSIQDEVGIWNRALTSTEVTALYNDGDGLQYPFPLDYTLTAETGTLTLTGYDASLGKSMSLLAETGNFILRGYDAILRCTGWQKQTKNTTTWTDQTKNSTTWDNQDRN